MRPSVNVVNNNFMFFSMSFYSYNPLTSGLTSLFGLCFKHSLVFYCCYFSEGLRSSYWVIFSLSLEQLISTLIENNFLYFGYLKFDDFYYILWFLSIASTFIFNAFSFCLSHPQFSLPLSTLNLQYPHAALPLPFVLQENKSIHSKEYKGIISSKK